MKKIQRQVSFKSRVKDRYVEGYFWGTDKFIDIPDGLLDDIKQIIKVVNSDEIFIRIKRTTKKDAKSEEQGK